MTAPALLARLEAQGVRLALNDTGDGLKVFGVGKPSPAVMEEVRAHKPALLAFLRGEGHGEEKTGQTVRPLPSSPSDLLEDPKPEDLPPTPSPLALPKAPARVWKDGKPRTEDGRLDLPALLALPGHCGNCDRFQPAPEEGADMGRCLAPARLWPAYVPPPFAIHAAHACAVQGGRGWQPAPHFQPEEEGPQGDV